MTAMSPGQWLATHKSELPTNGHTLENAVHAPMTTSPTRSSSSPQGPT
jgi:hypothetical protein